MKRLVIFDLDGTLLNTIADLAAATNHALLSLGLPGHPTEAYKQMVGNGVTRLLERALPAEERTAERISQMKAVFKTYYDRHNTDLTRPYDGIDRLLADLKSRNVMMAVASNKYQQATSRLVLHYFRQTHFCAILGQRDHAPLKPDPRIVRDIIGMAGAGQADVLYVGDSAVDVQTARNAGVESCGVTWGFCSRTMLEAESPDHLADTPADILNFV